MTATLRTLAQAAVIAIVGSASFAAVPSLAAEKTVEVGGAPMYPSKNIIENAVNSKDHTTLVETLSGKGPFTVFAPVNAAFEKLPAGTVDNLLKPENKKTLVAVLTYHVLAGKHSAESIEADIKKMGGKAEYKTVEGEPLTFSWKDKALWVMDVSGNTAKVTIADVNQSNGVIHVVDTVLMPKM
jgi:uncharacterized surface protein with fasciclin (FAS1) repeats